MPFWALHHTIEKLFLGTKAWHNAWMVLHPTFNIYEIHPRVYNSNNICVIWQELLPDLLSSYVEHLRKGKLNNKFSTEEEDENVDFGGSSGTVEDTCVKVSIFQKIFKGSSILMGSMFITDFTQKEGRA